MFRSGIGYDVHRLVLGRKLILGGIEIAHTHGLEGHSDADVLSHAIADALLGAAGQRDIGHHFPNTDPSIQGIDSQEILKKAQAVLAVHHYTIVNIDCSLIGESPKIGPYIEAMREKLAQSLLLPVDRIGIKATTNEGMGFIGRGEGIAAMAVASIQYIEPRSDPDQIRVA
jgi:2-C-methyl-D-erythritol 2,4-cyclodiphosphate synthase